MHVVEPLRELGIFVDLFVRQFDLRAIGDDERKLHSSRARALALRKHLSDSR